MTIECSQSVHSIVFVRIAALQLLCLATVYLQNTAGLSGQLAASAIRLLHADGNLVISFFQHKVCVLVVQSKRLVSQHDFHFFCLAGLQEKLLQAFELRVRCIVPKRFDINLNGCLLYTSDAADEL